MIQYVYVPDVMDPDRNKQAKKKTYICRNCHTVIVSSLQPPVPGCPTVAKNHKWYSAGLMGIKPRVYACRICGLRVSSSISPMTGTGNGSCEGGKNHQFM